MIPTEFTNPTEQALKALSGVRELQFSHPYSGPEYARLAYRGSRTETCYRMDWVTQEGKRYFAYVKPVLRRITRTMGSWPFKKSWEEDVDNIEATQAEALRLLRASVNGS